MNFIVVGGIPRSGTSLVQKILDLHPEIYGGPEFDNLPRIAQLYKVFRDGVETGRLSSYFNTTELTNYFRIFVENLFSNVSSDKLKYVSEKSPSNALEFTELRRILPKGKFIVVIRNPKSIIASLRNVNKRSTIKLDQGNYLYKDLIMLNKYYESISKVVNEPNVHIVYYEDLVKEPESTVTEICKFLDIQFTSEMLNTEKKNVTSELISSQNKTLSAWYKPEEFDRKIQDTEIDNWKSVLTRNEAHYINLFLSKKNYSFLDRYGEVQKISLVRNVLSYLSVLDGYTIKKVMSRIN